MAAGFSITISAVDSASARIDAINKRLAAISAPVQRLGKQLSTFSRLSGLTGLYKGFEGIARSAYSAFQSVARIVAPLGAITGAASVAGMYRMVEAWGQWGSQLGWAAQRIGISAAQLNIFQGAAQIAGASSGAMTSGLQGLGQSMYDAIGGRAPQTVALFNQLGIAFDDGTRHARSVSAVLPELANRIAGIKDPYTQARVATQLFGGAAEELLPFLRQGAKGIADLEARSKRYSYVTDGTVGAANRLRISQVDLTLAVGGFGNAISERLAPVIAPLIDWMADLIVKNRNWISLDAGKYAKEFADYIKQIDFKSISQGFGDFATKADNIATAFGGWKRVLEGIVAIKLAGWAFSAIAPFTGVLRLLALIPGSGVTAAALAAVGVADYAVGAVGTQGDVREQHSRLGQWIYDHSSALRYADNYLYGGAQNARMDAPTSEIQKARVAKTLGAFEMAGFTPAQASGPAANMMAESSMNPSAVNGSHYGIGQWDPARQASYAKLYGHTMQSVTDPDAAFQEQLKFYRYELTHGAYRNVGNTLRTAGSGFQAGSIISQGYEIPNDPDGSIAYHRGSLAQTIADDDKPAVQLADGSGGAGADGATGKVAVTISAPPGVKVAARSTGNVMPPKIARTGVGGEPNYIRDGY